MTNQSTKGCCEKCFVPEHDELVGPNYMLAEAVAESCSNEDCPNCHSQEPQQEGWIGQKINEFEKLYNHNTLCKEAEEGCTCLQQDWVRDALTEAYNLGKKEAEKIARKYKYGGDGCWHEYNCAFLAYDEGVCNCDSPAIKRLITNPQNRE